MNTLRRIHLYLGCAFAPLLTFFVVSGVWQTFHYNIGSEGRPAPYLIQLLSTLHMSRGLKNAGINDLSSAPFRWLVVAMAISLLVTMVLGVIMAFRFGRARLALFSLIGGFVVPLGLVAFKIAAH
jgi:hypothetical protein